MLIRSIGLSVGALLSMLPCGAAVPDSNALVKINQIQVIGTHNSYHAGMASSEARLLQQKNPKLYEALEYRHRPLDEQLTSGCGRSNWIFTPTVRAAATRTPWESMPSLRRDCPKTLTLIRGVS